eukprot:scaffold3254_cov273-Prasinococcus_capsulatus_cf.AAC.7
MPTSLRRNSTIFSRSLLMSSSWKRSCRCCTCPTNGDAHHNDDDGGGGESRASATHRGEALLMQQLLVARPDAGHLEQLLAGEAAALRGGHSKPPRSPPPRAPLLRLLWRAPARELPTARGAQRGAWLMRRVAAGARLEAKGPTILLLLLVRGRGAAAPPSRRAGERRRRQPRRRRRG